MKFKIISIICYFLNMSIVAQQFEVVLVIEKTKFMQYEPINILTKLKNLSTDKVTINNFIYGEEGIQINIYNQIGEKVKPYKEEEFHGLIPIYYDLLTGEEILNETDLLYYGNTCDMKEKITRFGCFFEPGQYRLSVEYHYKNVINNKKYEKSFISNEHFITINPPSESEDQKIIDELIQISNLRSFKMQRLDKCTEKAIKDVIEKYPNHPLTKQAYLHLNLENMKHYNFDRDKYMKKFCIAFPNSIRAISYAADFIKTDEEFKQKISGTNLLMEAEKMQKYKENKDKILKRNSMNIELIKRTEKNMEKK